MRDGGVLSIETGPDEVAQWAATAPLTEGVLTPFGVLDPERLSQDGCLDLLLGLERVKNWADAQQVRVLARLAARPEPIPALAKDREYGDQDFMREEIACLLRWPAWLAGDRMATATALVSRLPATLAGVEDGSISYLHAHALAETVRELDDSVAGKVQARVLPRAPQQTRAEFRRALRRAAAALDPRGHAEQHAACAVDRRVGCQPDQHGMAWLSAYLPAPDAQTIMTAVQAVADLSADDGRKADQKRADAFTAIGAAVLTGALPGAAALTGAQADNLPRWQGRRPNIQVTVALSTLTGLDDQPAELDRYGPIPADLARRIAADPTGTWRRLVTDEIGQLIDYGRSTYRPPQDLRDYVTARDITCRRPGCARSARRCDLDHLLDWNDGGDTNAANLTAECPRDHTLKHDGGWQVQRLDDGSTRWTTPHGRIHDKPAETYPLDQTRPRTDNNDPDPNAESPPF